MDDDIRLLVLAPFQEIVEKGKKAIENATDAGLTKLDEELKTAQSLVRGGERAMSKIEPVCRRLWEEYSTSFVDALKANEEIAALRSGLEDLLWDFDSFIEIDDFDASEYSKLQTLASKAGKRIYEILIRMKLEHPPIYDSAGISRTTSLTGRSSVCDTPLPPSETPETVDEEADDYGTTQKSEESTSDTITIMAAQAGPDLGYEVVRPPSVSNQTHSRQSQRQPEPESPVIPHQIYAESVRIEDIPPAPLINPWDPTVQPPADEDQTESRPPPDRRRREASEDSGRPYTPPFVVSNVFGEREVAHARPRRLDEGVEEMIRQANVVGHHPASPMAAPLDTSNKPLMTMSDRPLPSLPTASPTSPLTPEDRPGIGHIATLGQAARRKLPSHRQSQTSSTNSGRSSMFEPGPRDSVISPASDHGESVHDVYSRKESYTSIPEDRVVTSPVQSFPPGMPLPVRRKPSPTTQTESCPPYSETPSGPTQQSRDQTGLIVVQEQPGLQVEQPGLQVVLRPDGSAPESSGGLPPIVLREPNCNITVDSSFYQLKGFCDGAKDIIRGGVGVRMARKTGFGPAHNIAKCSNKKCMFELAWDSVAADANKSEDANYRNSGIGFRLRFISKSHLEAEYIDDHKYGCLFCVQLGRTTEESDATVFPDQRALFAHLARHPRPLPPVPGLTVVESAEIPPQFRNNYDLHLPQPPARSLMTGLARELSAMPTAVATETARRMPFKGFRTAPDPNVATLQFFTGQRIVGIEFPARFGGEWALGWADNVRGAFLVDSVRLDAPPEKEVRKTTGSGLRAVARWKRHPRDKEVKEGGWLKFEKGEAITHISFPYAEHWCWYGSNSKGKHGIFPQSYMEPNTLSETDKASIISEETNRSGASKMLAQFSRASTRRRDGRPGSSTGSHASSDTAIKVSSRFG